MKLVTSQQNQNTMLENSMIGHYVIYADATLYCVSVIETNYNIKHHPRILRSRLSSVFLQKK